MTARKRKKNRRMRGTRTCSWGSKRRHRNKGHKGGAGMAGTGKRADSKKPSIWKERYFGKIGFKIKGVRKEIRAINVDELEKNLVGLLASGKISKEKDKDIFIINLSDIGYDKLIGKGVVKHAMRITVCAASEKSVAKVQEKNGEVLIEGD